jgi:hypothetical protein
VSTCDARRAVSWSWGFVAARACLRGQFAEWHSQEIRGMVARVEKSRRHLQESDGSKSLLDQKTDPWWAGCFGYQRDVEVDHEGV